MEGDVNFKFMLSFEKHEKKNIDIYRHIFLKNIHMVLYVDFLFVCRIALFGQ